MTTSPTDTVVVAVNGSAESAAALRWAAAEASRAGLSLRIVTAYQQLQVITDTVGAYVEHSFAADDAARAQAAATIAEVLGSGARFEHVVACGPTEALLRKHSADAALIVIGTRRKNTWYHELRGSLTNRITGSVACPVVSVPLSAPEQMKTSISEGG